MGIEKDILSERIIKKCVFNDDYPTYILYIYTHTHIYIYIVHGKLVIFTLNVPWISESCIEIKTKFLF